MTTKQSYALIMIHERLYRYIEQLDIDDRLQGIILRGLSQYYAERVSESHNKDLVDWFPKYVDNMGTINVSFDTKVKILSNTYKEYVEELSALIVDIVSQGLKSIEEDVLCLLQMSHTELTQ